MFRPEVASPPKDLSEPVVDPPAERAVLVVGRRGPRVAWKFLPPLVLVLGSPALVAYRASTAEGPTVPRAAARRSAAVGGSARPEGPAPLLASAMTPSPAPRVAPDGAPADPPPRAPAAEPAPKREAIWDDIRREAERRKAELDELKRQKEEAARRAPDPEPAEPRPRRGQWRILPPADVERMMREAAEQQRVLAEQMFRDHLEFQRRIAEEMDRMRGAFPGPGLPGPAFGMVAPPFTLDEGPAGGGPGHFRGEIVRPGFQMQWEFRIESSDGVREIVPANPD